jgi:hypothetical protein
MLIDQVVHTAARPIRLVVKIEQDLHFVQGHPECPAAADGVQTFCMSSVIEPVVRI